MKTIIISLLSLIISTSVFSQVLTPVKWKSKTEKISETEFNLIFEAKIDDGWHVYSQFTPADGPLPIEMEFKNQKGNYKLIGKTIESKTQRKFNDVFGVDEIFFEKSFSLKQKIKILKDNVTKVDASVAYQTCKEACINDTKKFVFEIPKYKIPATEDKTTTAVTTVSETVVPQAIVPSTKITQETNLAKEQETSKPAKKEDKKGLWTIFILAFLGGIGATFTPCVYPMIPMTVSFFLKQSGNKAKGRFNAIFYGICIVFICFAITLPFHIFEGINRDIFSQISTNVYLNLLFFSIFFLFAISFFGAFEITMPSNFTNKVDNASNKSGLIGVFFMALTLIIVSFSCIGPALGFVFGTSLNSDGGAIVLSVAMTAFGIGLALPFMFFALAPSLLGNLPKSGGWLNTVKVVFGFVELALAFKFLSNADIGMELHWLQREVFIAIWIAIFASLTLYLFGKLTLPHDSPLNHISVGRLLFGVITLAFTLYLVPGLWGAPVKLISAFPPPKTYSESPQGFNSNIDTSGEMILPKDAVFSVHNLISFEDYQEGLAYAKKVNKPILIDFTGKQCVNCRLMENNVWSDANILKILKNEVVLISLYGDDKEELPKEEWYISKENGNEINTVGEKWSEFQIQKFNNNSRPLYVLLDLNEEQLTVPVPYTPDIKAYKNWLQQGIANYKK